MTEYNEWMPQQEVSVTTEQLDQAVQTVRQLREEYEQQKKLSTAAHDKVEQAEQDLVNLLKAAGKSKYEAEGVGLAYITTKETYRVPSSIDAKKELFDYIKTKNGPDVLMAMVSINHQTLNSWTKKELEADPMLSIPGLEEPTSQETLSFRRK